MASIKTSFIIFAVICTFGVAASVVRGKVTSEVEKMKMKT